MEWQWIQAESPSVCCSLIFLLFFFLLFFQLLFALRMQRCFHTTTRRLVKNAMETGEPLVLPRKIGLEAFPPPAVLLPKDRAHVSHTFARPVQFIKSISALDQAPRSSLPEVAFVGRSNVGKSTLINALTNNHTLAKTSSKPGHTRVLNFFNVSDQCILVDMPGYGFRSREEWGDLIIDYISNRSQLKRLFILIDPTAGLKDTDRNIMQMMDEKAVSYQIILTKRDKLRPEAYHLSKTAIEKYLLQHAICCYPEMLASGKARSSKNNRDQVAKDLLRVRRAVLLAAGVLS